MRIKSHKASREPNISHRKKKRKVKADILHRSIVMTQVCHVCFPLVYSVRRIPSSEAHGPPKQRPAGTGQLRMHNT